jgi:signal transduction histidine kinase
MLRAVRALRSSVLDRKDLATFNRWLCVTRIRAVALLAVLTAGLQLASPGAIDLPPVLAVFAGLGLCSWIGLGTSFLARRPLAFFMLQTLVDLGGVTVGVAAGVHGTPALLLRSLYALVIVPVALISSTAGIAVAVISAAAHVVILRHDGVPVVSAAGLVPLALFFAIAQQCFFYARHLDEKNRVLAALVEVARTLGTTLAAPELLARVTGTLRDLLDADWVGTFLVDAERRAFRVVALTGRAVRLDELARIDLPLGAWPDLARLDDAGLVVLEGDAAARVPHPFVGDVPVTHALLGGLHRDGALRGFVAVGWQGRAAPASAERLLAGVAEHAAIVLRNAQLLEEVQLASALKSEFVGAVSHELRSPLNVILGYTEMLRDGAMGDVTPEQAGALDRTHRQALALLEMITALLDLNRLEAGRLPVEGVPVVVDDLLDELVDQIPDGWRRSGVALGVEVAAGLPVIVTDPGKLKTVLRNLVHNALKFTEHGRVTVAAVPDGDVGIAFVVEDTGCGIPDDALPYVFDMFRQVPGAGGGGVGLGLHLVRRLVAALGGTVSATSRVGVGTCFRVVVPVGESGERAVA